MVNVAGVHYEQLEKFLKATIGHYFRNFDLSVNLGKPRSIQVLIVGDGAPPRLLYSRLVQHAG